MKTIEINPGDTVILLDECGRRKWETTGARLSQGLEDTLQMGAGAPALLLQAAEQTLFYVTDPRKHDAQSFAGKIPMLPTLLRNAIAKAVEDRP